MRFIKYVLDEHDMKNHIGSLTCCIVQSSYGMILDAGGQYRMFFNSVTLYLLIAAPRRYGSIFLGTHDLSSPMWNVPNMVGLTIFLRSDITLTTQLFMTPLHGWEDARYVT